MTEKRMERLQEDEAHLLMLLDACDLEQARQHVRDVIGRVRLELQAAECELKGAKEELKRAKEELLNLYREYTARLRE